MRQKHDKTRPNEGFGSVDGQGCLVRPRVSRPNAQRPTSNVLATRTFGRAVALTLAVLFVGVLHGDRLVQEELPVHGLDGGVRRLKGLKADEPKALGVSGLEVAPDLRGRSRWKGCD